MNNSKKNLVFLPGKLCDHRLWAYHQDRLKEIAQITCIDLSQSNTLEEMISAISDQSPETFALAGFSMGGYLALEYVLQNPKRVERLAIIGSSSRGYDETLKRYYRGIIHSLENFKFQGFSKKSIEQLIHPSRHHDTRISDLIQTMAIDLGGDVLLRQQKATLNREDRRGELSKIQCPTLVMGGREDELVSFQEVEELAHGISHSRLHLIENCGHMIPLEYPELLETQLREWMKGEAHGQT